MLLTSGLAIINNEFQGKARAGAYAFWGSCLGIAITCGPIIGGVISSFWGWNWVFLVNLPICAFLIIATYKIIPESRSPSVKKLDYAGVLTFSAGLLFVTWAVIDGNALGWASTKILLRFAAGAILLQLFVMIERMQREPMVVFSAFASARFAGSSFAMLGYSGGAQVMIFYLPMFLQTTYDFTPIEAVLAMLPFAFPMFLIPKLSSRMSNRRSEKSMLGIALSITTGADLVMAALSHSGVEYWTFASAMTIAGIGAGLLNTETAKAMQGAIPPDQSGMGSGISATVRFGGLLISVAGLGAVLAASTVRVFSGASAQLGLSHEDAQDLAQRFVTGEVQSATSMSGGTTAQYHALLTKAFETGFAYTSATAALIACTALILVFVTLPSSSRRSSAQHVQGSTVPGE